MTRRRCSESAGSQWTAFWWGIVLIVLGVWVAFSRAVGKGFEVVDLARDEALALGGFSVLAGVAALGWCAWLDRRDRGRRRARRGRRRSRS